MSETFDELCARLDAENARLDADPRFPELLEEYRSLGTLMPESLARLEIKTGKPTPVVVFSRVDGVLVERSMDAAGVITETKLASPESPGMRCASCGNSSDRHCRVHEMPCCPGKCKPQSAAMLAEPEPVSEPGQKGLFE